MHRTAFADLVSSLDALTPQQLTQLDDALSTSKQRVEAVLTVDARGAESNPCPRCASSASRRWGRTRTHVQRWNCKDCGATWSGLTGTPLAGLRRPAAFIGLLRNMLETEAPWSCRKAAKHLGISRDTAWRWRMTIIRLLTAEPDGVMTGIVEADEARQRESRKGSREWAQYKADPANTPRPPRETWARYLSWNATVKTPPGGWRAWDQNLLAVTDRAGHRAFEVVPRVTVLEVSAALLPVMAADSFLVSDGHLTYETIAKRFGITHFALNAGRRSGRTQKSHHINTVNALIGRFRTFLRPFCGPATKYLKGYGRWYAFRKIQNRDYLRVFNALVGAP